LKFQLPEPQTPIAYPSTPEELEALRVFHKRNLRPEMVGIHALNGLAPHNSASRSVMMTQHIPQHLVISGLEKPYIISGPEYRLSKYTFNTKMPANSSVKAVINRYSWTMGAGGVRGTPERTLIFSREDNGRLDYLNVQEWSSYHTYFGYRNKIFPVTNRITDNTNLPKDLVLADTPANTDDDCYCYGLNLETAFFDRRATAEDGAIVSKSALRRMTFRVYETREVGMGSHEFPLALYGMKDGQYKIFPDIGEEVREDGLIMATRPYSDRLSVANMSVHDVTEVDHYFDTKCYSRESLLNKDVQEGIKAGTMKALRGRVVDIKVIRNNSHNSMLPPMMTEQLNRYHTALVNYYSQVLDVVRKYEVEDRRRGGTGFVPMTPGLQNFLARARVLAGQGGNRFTGNIDLQYKRASLDEYTVYFVIEHEIVPSLGFKISDTNGSSHS
jgi:hypothetical protein